MEVQYYNGVKFTRANEDEYFSNGTLHMRMHRFVWLCEKGDIPKGYEIHHIDFDKSNNDISNLVCLSRAEHRKLHAEHLTDEEREWRRKNLAENARPKASEWHKSEEGRKWHREHGNTTGLNIPVAHNCKQCGKEFMGPHHAKFCCNACKSKWRRQNNSDCIEVHCCICGKVYKTNKYRPAKTCSRGCANTYRSLPD